MSLSLWACCLVYFTGASLGGAPATVKRWEGDVTEEELERYLASPQPCWSRCRHCQGFLGGGNLNESDEKWKAHLAENPPCARAHQAWMDLGFTNLLERLGDGDSRSPEIPQS